MVNRRTLPYPVSGRRKHVRSWTAYHVQRLLAYFVSAVLWTLFCLDLSDWIDRDMTNTGLLVGDKESRIIVTMAILRTQFTYFLAATAQLHFAYQLKRRCEFRVLLNKLSLDLSENTSAENDIPRQIVQRQSTFYPRLVLACVACLNFVVYVCSFAPIMLEPQQEWKLVSYSTLTLPVVVSDVFVNTTILLAQLLTLWLHAGLVEPCALLSQWCGWYNKTLAVAITQLEEECHRHSETFGKIAIDGGPSANTLDRLARNGRRIAVAVDEMNETFSGFIGIIMGGNCLVIVAGIASAFIGSLFCWGVLSYVWYGGILSAPIIVLILILHSCATLNDLVLKSKRLWEDLELAREARRKLAPGRHLGGELLTILHWITSDLGFLTVAGTVRVTRFLAVSVIGGFVGVLCFFIDRSENYVHDHAIAQLKGACANVSLVQ